MPWAPKRPCSWPGCGALTDVGRCEKHRKQERKQIDERRGTGTQRGYGVRWQAARRAYLSDHPWCAICLEHNKRNLAFVVDHIKPHKGDMALFWDTDNWQALCKECHDVKTAGEGRWG